MKHQNKALKLFLLLKRPSFGEADVMVKVMPLNRLTDVESKLVVTDGRGRGGGGGGEQEVRAIAIK